jgi:hypothetical protein
MLSAVYYLQKAYDRNGSILSMSLVFINKYRDRLFENIYIGSPKNKIVW